jgi:hypothetical protein
MDESALRALCEQDLGFSHAFPCFTSCVHGPGSHARCLVQGVPEDVGAATSLVNRTTRCGEVVVQTLPKDLALPRIQPPVSLCQSGDRGLRSQQAAASSALTAGRHCPRRRPCHRQRPMPLRQRRAAAGRARWRATSTSCLTRPAASLPPPRRRSPSQQRARHSRRHRRRRRTTGACAPPPPPPPPPARA